MKELFACCTGLNFGRLVCFLGFVYEPVFFSSKLDLCEGGSILPIFKSDIKISLYHISCFISVCPFVALSEAECAENLHIVLSSPY